MTDERNYLNNINLYFESYAIFGDGAKGKSIRKGSLDHHGLPCLNDEVLVDGLIANLISISKLYYQDDDENIFMK